MTIRTKKLLASLWLSFITVIGSIYFVKVFGIESYLISVGTTIAVLLTATACFVLGLRNE